MPPEEDRATATVDLHNKFCDGRSSGSRDMLTDRQTDTHTDGRVDHSTPNSYRVEVTMYTVFQKKTSPFLLLR